MQQAQQQARNFPRRVALAAAAMCQGGGMERPAGIPLRPEPSVLRDRAAISVVRAVVAKARATFTMDRDATRLVRAALPDDRGAIRIVTRAASSPAMTTADRRGTDRGDRTKWARQRPIGVFQLRRSVAR